MVACVVGVQYHQDTLVSGPDLPDLLDHARCDRVALDRRYRGGERVCGQHRASVRANVDVDPEHLTLATQKLEHACTQDERPAVRDSRLDHKVGPSVPDQLLNDDDVLRVLNDRNPEPGEVVRIAV